MNTILMKLAAFICAFLILTCQIIPWLASNNMLPIPIIIILMTLICFISGYITYCLLAGIFKKIIDKLDDRSDQIK